MSERGWGISIYQTLILGQDFNRSWFWQKSRRSWFWHKSRRSWFWGDFHRCSNLQQNFYRSVLTGKSQCLRNGTLHLLGDVIVSEHFRNPLGAQFCKSQAVSNNFMNCTKRDDRKTVMDFSHLNTVVFSNQFIHRVDELFENDRWLAEARDSSRTPDLHLLDEENK